MPALRILVTRAIPDASLARLAGALPHARVEVNSEDRNLSRAELLARARGVEALLCTLADPIDRGLLEALAPPLRVVSTFAVGYENIDLEAARRLGVRVAHTPGVLTEATAEIAVALLLACARRVAEGDRALRAGALRGLGRRSRCAATPSTARRVGIVGAGRIGLRVARTLKQRLRLRDPGPLA